jgi:hypothetical protein
MVDEKLDKYVDQIVENEWLKHPVKPLSLSSDPANYIGVQPKYKKVKELKPHCPICREKLFGNNSIINPYKCSCGSWTQNRNLTFDIENKSDANT